MRSFAFIVLLVAYASVFAQTPAHAARRHTPPSPPMVPAKPLQKSNITDPDRLKLRASSLMVIEQPTGIVLLARNTDAVTPIASVTKLMTSMVILDAKLPLAESITIDNADIDALKGTHSRLRTGSRLPRRELLRLALIASENRAAAALARTYPGGRAAFVAAMNHKAKALAMNNTHFVDPAGLNKDNVSTASDLVRMVGAASAYPLIKQFTTTASHSLSLNGARSTLVFRNTNRLVQAQNRDWKIQLSKTGYTAEAGRCLVMQAKMGARSVIIVLLNSWGKLTPVGDANRIRRWLESRPVARQLTDANERIQAAALSR